MCNMCKEVYDKLCYSEDFQRVIENRRRNCSTDPEQLEKMSLVFQKLIPALDAIRYEYEQ